MSRRTKLTMRKIADLKNETDRTLWVHDAEVRGLCVSVTPTGKKGYYFVGRLNGRSRRVKLGPFPQMKLTEARDCCREMIVDASKGKDRVASRRAGKRTLGELWQVYLETHAKPQKRSWERDVVVWERHLSRFQRKPLVEIRRGWIASLVADIVRENSKSAGHHVRALLSTMFSLAVKREWVEYNPVTGTDRPSYEPRDRYLRPDEVKRFFEAVDALQRQTTKDFIKLAVFTGARRGNLAEMRWEELDLDRGLWTIPKAKFKSKREKVVPLIPQALDILRRRFADRVNGTLWVFPGGGRTGHITEPKAALDKVKEAAGITDLRFHDLRRSLGAWQNNAGVSLRLIQQSLGDANIQTTAAVYTPTDHEAVRSTVAAVVAAMMKES